MQIIEIILYDFFGEVGFKCSTQCVFIDEVGVKCSIQMCLCRPTIDFGILGLIIYLRLLTI